MVTDFLSWMLKYQNGDWSDVVNCFGYPGLHHFFHAINFCLYKVVGPSHLAWYLILSSMHGLVTYALHRWINRMNDSGIINIPSKLIWLIAIGFLIFPFNVEAIVWKACLHYLILSFMFISGLDLLCQYLKEPYHKKLIYIHILFTLCLFTLELSYAFPLACLFLIFFYKLNQNETKVFESLVKVTGIQFLILTLYLILTKWVIGDYIGHYGAEKHMVFDPDIILSHAWSYFFKNLCFVHFWSFKLKSWFYTAFLANPIVHIGLTIISLGVLVYCIYKWKDLTNNIRFSALQLVLFFIGLAPIVNLFFMWILYYENDRYGYLANIFFIPCIYILLYQLPKILKFISLSVYTFFIVYFFCSMMLHSFNAGKVAHRLLDTFPKIEKDKSYFITSIPDNYRGLYLFRDYTDDAIAFRESLDLFRNRSQDIELIDISQYNQHLTTDSIKLDFVNDSTLHIGFQQYKNWFWRKGIGISNYENDILKVVKKPGYLKLTIKNPQSDQRFLYPEGGIWKTESWPQIND